MIIEDDIPLIAQELFAKTERESGGDANAALRLAFILLWQRNDLTLDGTITSRSFIFVKRKNEKYIKMLRRFCAEFTGVHTAANWQQVVFRGDKTGVSVARELFCCLKNKIDRECAKRGFAGHKKKDGFRRRSVLIFYIEALRYRRFTAGKQ
jgi:hypothetical protein